MGIMLASNWPDLMLTDLRKVYMDQYAQLPMMIPDVFNVLSTDKPFEQDTQVGSVPDHVEFSGRIQVVEPEQGYDKTYTFTEYAAQIQIQRRLAADDMQRVIDRRPKGLATSANRSREKLGASMYNLAFTYEAADGDGTELCAADHPSNVAGVSTQSNENTLALGATNIEVIRLAMTDFRDDQGEMTSVDGDTLMIPPAQEQTGWEIINSKGQVDTANNNGNFHEGKYKMIVWKRLTDVNNWFMIDYSGLKEYALWWNREAIQFFQDKDSDTMIAKYLSYYRCGVAWADWVWIYGNLVA